MTLEDLVAIIEKDPKLEAMGQYNLTLREIGEYGGHVDLSISRIEIDHQNKRIVFVD